MVFLCKRFDLFQQRVERLRDGFIVSVVGVTGFGDFSPHQFSFGVEDDPLDMCVGGFGTLNSHFQLRVEDVRRSVSDKRCMCFSGVVSRTHESGNALGRCDDVGFFGWVEFHCEDVCRGRLQKVGEAFWDGPSDWNSVPV